MRTSEYWDEVQPLETDATADRALSGDTVEKAAVLVPCAVETAVDGVVKPTGNAGNDEDAAEQPAATESSMATQTAVEQPVLAEVKEASNADAAPSAAEELTPATTDAQPDAE